MPVDFFAKELGKAQNRFNTILGNLSVFNIKTRQSLIIAICWMGVLKNKINTVKDKELARDNIRKFVKYRNLVNNVFNQIETEFKKGRAYDDNSDDRTKGHKKADTGR